jgi:hypothetical protein
MAAGLQPDGGDDPLRLGEPGQRDRLLGVPGERPFAIDMLAGRERRLHRLGMGGHAHHDGDGVDLGRGGHLAVVVESETGTECGARFLGRVGPCGADGGQLEIGMRAERRQMRPRRPRALGLGADDADPDLVRHDAPPGILFALIAAGPGPPQQLAKPAVERFNPSPASVLGRASSLPTSIEASGLWGASHGA